MLVRKLRLQRAWSQETLAEVSGVSVRTIQRIERGAEPSLDTRTALAAAFDVDADIFAKETEMTPPASQTVTESERDALEYVRDIKGFYSHLFVYGVVITGLVMVWLLQSTSYPWFLWPMFGWGVGVFAHGVSVFEFFRLFSADWERRQVEKRLNRKQP